MEFDSPLSLQRIPLANSSSKWYASFMAYVTSSFVRMTRSARGEFFNPLIYPFLIVTLAYGVGFTVFRKTEAVAASSLFEAMHSIDPVITLIWGVLAVAIILVGMYVLIFDKPPIGKLNCFIAWMLWFFAGVVYVLVGGWLTLFAVVVPSLYFWTWQYFSLAKFRAEDILDSDSMDEYDDGQYDSRFGGKRRRLDNRGVSEEDRTPD